MAIKSTRDYIMEDLGNLNSKEITKVYKYVRALISRDEEIIKMRQGDIDVDKTD